MPGGVRPKGLQVERSRDLSSDVLPPLGGVDTTAFRTNKPVKLRRTAADRRRRAHRKTTKNAQRWNGGAFTPSRHRERELKDLRMWEELGASDDLPNFERCIGASSLLGMANGGAIAAYEPQARRALALRVAIARDFELPCKQPQRFDCECCTRKDKAFRARCASMLFWLVRIKIAPIAEREHEWLIARHVDIGKLLHCCPRIAFDVMRHLHKHGWIRRAPQYDAEHVTLPCGKQYRRHVRGPSAYAIADRALEVLGIVSLPSLPKCEASEPQGVSFTSPNEPGLEPARGASSSWCGAPASSHSGQREHARPAAHQDAPAPVHAALARYAIADEATDALTALQDPTRPDAPLRQEGKSKTRTRSTAHDARALAMLRRREAQTAELIQRNERRAARAELAAEQLAGRNAVAARLNTLVQTEAKLLELVSVERAQLRVDTAAPCSSSLTRCPRCNTPTHASESDDDGVCVACMRAGGREPIEPSRVDEPMSCANLSRSAEPVFVLSDAELAEMRERTPKPPPRRDDDDPSDAIRRAWETRFGKVAVVVEPVLASLKRDGGDK